MDLRDLAGDLKALMALAGLSGRSKKRRAEEDTVIEAALLAFEGFDEEELEAIKHAQGKGPGSRPGGSNATGRIDYSMSTWARMLRDEATHLGPAVVSAQTPAGAGREVLHAGSRRRF